MQPPYEAKTFYCYFKPIAVICKILGIFPLQNILAAKDPKDLKVKIISFAHLYSFLIFACTMYMIYYFSGFMFERTHSVYVLIVVYVMILRSFVCFMFCGSLSSKLPILIRLLDTFDKKKRPVLIDRTGSSSLRYFAFWTALPIVLGFLAFSISFVESVEVVLETIPPELGATNGSIAACFFGALSIWQVIPLLMYIYFSFKIKSNFNIINRTLLERGYSGCVFDENVKYPEDMDEVMEYLRHMHNVCTKSVHELGKFYGNFMAIDQLCIIVMVIVNICTFLNDATKEAHLMTLTTFNILIVVAVLVISHQIRESGMKVIDLLHGIVFSRVSEKCRTEIQTFMLQISVWPPEVSAAGYFIIDKRQIPSVLSSIATYLVVSLQFLDEAKYQEMIGSNCTTTNTLVL